MKTLLLIDGNAIMHRAFHALPPLTSKNGTPTNMIYGFFMMVYKVWSDYKPDYLVVCFDTPKPTFRQELMEEYQAHRPHAPDEFKVQIPYIRQLIDSAGITRMEKDGFEADDVIGTLASQYASPELKVFILTGDKDIMQLVNENISVISPKIGISSTNIYTPDEVKQKLGISPSQIPDYKALAGDPSDNYKGVKGIGPKTASKLILEFKSVENLLDKLDTVKEDKTRTSLQEYRDMIILTKKIATIVKNVDLEFDLEQSRFSAFKEEMKTHLNDLQLFSLIKRIFPADSKKELKTSNSPKDPQPGLF